MRSKRTMQHQRLLWTAFILSCAADDGRYQNDNESRVRGRRRRRPLQTHRRRPSHPIQPDLNDNAGLHPTYRRLSTGECSTDEQPFLLTFQTDSYGSETRWFLRTNSDGDYVGYGPPDGITYGDFTLYSFSYCLTIGQTYTLAMEDNFGDGMCCSRGHGGYEYSIGNVRAYSTNLRPTFRDYVEHTFTIEGTYTPSPTMEVTQAPELEMECAANPAECGCDDVEHEDYEGTISTTEDGYTCQAWNVQTPHAHDYSTVEYPDGNLSENYCRSPDGGYPWCYTTDPDVEWDWCRLPSCPLVAKAPSTLSPSKEPSTLVPTKAPMVGSMEPTESPVTWPTTERPTKNPTKSPSAGPTMKPTEPATSPPTNPPTPKPTPDRNFMNPLTGCFGGDVQVRVEVRSDNYSDETSWDLYDPDGNQLMGRIEGSYGILEYSSDKVCVPYGNHTFVIRDKHGDGMCCRFGEGFYKVHLNGREVLNGGSFNNEIVANINVGYDNEGYMAEREFQYLEAHNSRRKEWHEMYNLTYVPLVYSPALAADAKAWADELLHSCGVKGIEHESANPFGENLAKNRGNDNAFGQLYHPDLITGRWVDREIGLPYPSNGHLTQALWRASKYLGCGESVKPFRGGVCRIQVCRYSRAGNCDMTRFNAREGENWLIPMLDNYTRCGPDCPQEGCF